MIVKISNSSAGVTLMEMLVVIMIIGLLLAVVYRTIDATTYSSRFNETTKEMTELIKAFTGNPDVISDGRRINFGYVGDMGRLPEYIDGLFRSDGTNWKGPYIPSKFIEDSMGFKVDAWGNAYEYNRDNGYIRSTGGGKQILTMPIADSVSYLLNNQIAGTITDINGAPPVELSPRIRIRLTIPQDGNLVDYEENPRSDGYFEFTPFNSMPVPIGYHRLVVTKEFGNSDSIVRWISVLPRSNMIADFRFSTSFRNNLKYVENTGVAIGDSLNNVGFSVFNSGDSMTLDSLVIIHLDVTAYYEQAAFQGTQVWDYNSLIRAGLNTQIALNPKPVIPTNSVVRFDLKGFMDNSLGLGNPIDMTNNRIAIRFSDGSVIDFVPQASP